MIQSLSDPEKTDLLYSVITKLSVVSDFMQSIDDPGTCIRDLTPIGLELIIRECIAVLKMIGGFNERPELN